MARRNREQEENDRRQRQAYVGALTAGLVHEVRTPLNAIQLNAQMLAEDIAKLPPELRARFERRCQRVYKEVKALTRTLDAFLAFARPPRFDPTPTDLNHFLRDFIEFVRPEMEEYGVSVTAKLARDLYPVVMDQQQFTHVLLNLFRNAREAIEQRRDEADSNLDGQVTLETNQNENESDIVIAITDNGIGIEPGTIEEIFEAFYTTKPKGTGLGLGIVRRIIEDHRGTISAEPATGYGAKFLLRLPRGHFLEYAGEENP